MFSEIYERARHIPVAKYRTLRLRRDFFLDDGGAFATVESMKRQVEFEAHAWNLQNGRTYDEIRRFIRAIQGDR